MALDDETGGEGRPIEGGPEWGSVEEERDYWKALAQSYAAKLLAIKRTVDAEWVIEDIENYPHVVSHNVDYTVDQNLGDKLT